MSILVTVCDALSNLVGVAVLVGATGFCAAILPSAWRGR